MAPRSTGATGIRMGSRGHSAVATLCLLVLTAFMVPRALGLGHAGEVQPSAARPQRGEGLPGTALAETEKAGEGIKFWAEGGVGGVSPMRSRGNVGGGSTGRARGNAGEGSLRRKRAEEVALEYSGGLGRRSLRQRMGGSRPEGHLGVVPILETVNSTKLAPAWLDAALGALALSKDIPTQRAEEPGSGSTAPLLTCRAHWECPALRPCHLWGRGRREAEAAAGVGEGEGGGEVEAEVEIEACAVPLAQPSGDSASSEGSQVRQLLTGESAKAEQVLPGGALLNAHGVTPSASSPACPASPSSGPGAMLFLLSNVFVDAQGNVFDRRHWYHSRGNADQFVHCQGTQAAEYDKVLYLLPSRGPSTATAPSSEEALPQGTDCGGSRGRGRSSERGGAPWVYQRLVEDLVPMVFSLAPILPQLRSEYRWLLPPSRHLRHFSEDMFGIDLSSRALHLHQAAAAHPIFVRQLLVPVLSHCEQWRQNLWRTIRHHHLLPYQGFPIFFSNWTANPAPAPGLPTAPNSPFPTNWVALYAPGVAAVHQGQDAALHAALLAAGVPQERVVVLEPTAKLHQIKEVLNRAVLLVGPTSATLPHVIFMPPGAALIEILVAGADGAPEGRRRHLQGSTRALEGQGDGTSPEPGRPSTLPAASSVLHLTLLCHRVRQQGLDSGTPTDTGSQGEAPRPGACFPQDLSAAVRTALETLTTSIPGLKLPTDPGVDGSRPVQMPGGENTGSAGNVGEAKAGSADPAPASSASPGATGTPPDLMTMSLQPYELDEAKFEERAKQATEGTLKRTTLLGLVVPDQNASLDVGEPQIRGSQLRDAASVAEFQEWMQCIGREGRWEYNATPRSVPWEYTGYTNLCDHRLEDGGRGVASKRAEALVQAGVDAAGWNVRDALKYQWVVDSDKCKGTGADKGAGVGSAGAESQGPSQAYVRYNPADFCAKMRQYAERRDEEEEARGAVPQWRRKGSFTILIVGDSIQQQLTATLANHLLWHVPKLRASWAQWAVNKSECYSWVPHQQHEHCRRYDFHPDACPGVSVHFVSNRWLHILDPFAAKESVPWSEYAGLVEADVVILNRGPHYTSDELYTQGVNMALHFLRLNFPNKLILYRSSPPGHHNCSTTSQPLAHRQNAADLQRFFQGYHWDAFAGQNEIAKRLAAQYGVAFMDVVPMMELRADGHRSWMEPSDRDCLHYCTPGPIDVMVEVLYNMLLRLLFREPSKTRDVS